MCHKQFSCKIKNVFDYSVFLFEFQDGYMHPIVTCGIFFFFFFVKIFSNKQVRFKSNCTYSQPNIFILGTRNNFLSTFIFLRNKALGHVNNLNSWLNNWYFYLFSFSCPAISISPRFPIDYIVFWKKQWELKLLPHNIV